MQDTLLNFGRVRSLVDSSVLRANEGQLFWSATRNWYTVVFFWWKKTWHSGNVWKCMGPGNLLIPKWCRIQSINIHQTYPVIHPVLRWRVLISRSECGPVWWKTGELKRSEKSKNISPLWIFIFYRLDEWIITRNQMHFHFLLESMDQELVSLWKGGFQSVGKRSSVSLWCFEWIPRTKPMPECWNPFADALRRLGRLGSLKIRLTMTLVLQTWVEVF